MRKFEIFIFISIICSCDEIKTGGLKKAREPAAAISKTSLVVLGTIQDGGSPHIGCKKNCCKDLFANPDKNRMVVCLGIIDPDNKKNYLFEATPDLPMQIKKLKALCSFKEPETPDAIFVTHAHIGHYAGLMYLGKEALNAKEIEVFAMPRMKSFIEQNGPWSQLVNSKNILLRALKSDSSVSLTSNLKVTPFKVPHRDEFSETVGYIIEGPNKKVLFIPDIDKWQKWDRDIGEALQKVDYAFIDATFYDGEEINNRDISEIPHPFIIESIQCFKGLPLTERKKIYFIHFNHTNPAINKDSKQAKEVIRCGFKLAEMDQVLEL